MWQNILVMRFMETLAGAMLHHNNVYASFIGIHLLRKKNKTKKKFCHLRM